MLYPTVRFSAGATSAGASIPASPSGVSIGSDSAAAGTSIIPDPYRLSRWPAGSLASSGFRAVSSSAAPNSAGVTLSVVTDDSSATAPATCGVAMLVPNRFS